MLESTIHIEKIYSSTWEWMYRIHCDTPSIIDAIYAWCVNNCDDENSWICWKGWQAKYLIIAFNDLDTCTRFLCTWDEFND